MKHAFAVLSLLIWASPSFAQAQPISPTEPPPGVFVDYLQTHAASGEIVDHVRAWPVDADAIAPQDYLVQVAYAAQGGGNAYWLRHFIFVGRADGSYQPAEIPDIASGINAVQQQSEGLTLVLFEYLDGDPRCCPSGSSEVFLDFSRF